MKKVIINIILIFTMLFIYFLQSNFFSWFNIAGVMPNMFIILVLFIGLFTNRTLGTIYGMIIGIYIDLVIGTKIGVTAVAFGLIGLMAAIFDKNFSKDSRMTIMLMVLGATIVGEIFIYLLKYVFLNNNIEILNFIKILVLEGIFNVILTIVLYPLIQKFGYYIEDEYKGNKILTRYF